MQTAEKDVVADDGVSPIRPAHAAEPGARELVAGDDDVGVDLPAHRRVRAHAGAVVVKAVADDADVAAERVVEGLAAEESRGVDRAIDLHSLHRIVNLLGTTLEGAALHQDVRRRVDLNVVVLRDPGDIAVDDPNAVGVRHADGHQPGGDGWVVAVQGEAADGDVGDGVVAAGHPVRF
jgi:hypothetical protein